MTHLHFARLGIGLMLLALWVDKDVPWKFWLGCVLLAVGFTMLVFADKCDALRWRLKVYRRRTDETDNAGWMEGWKP